MLLRLKYQNPSSLTHDKPVPRLVPGTGGSLELVVVLGEGPAGHEAPQADLMDRGLRASCKHHVGPARADVVGGSSEAVVGGGACSGDGVVGAHETLFNGHEGAPHIGVRVGDGERAEFEWVWGPFSLVQGRRVVLHRLQTPHPRANEAASLLLVKFFPSLWVRGALEAGLHEGLLGCYNAVPDNLIILAVQLLGNQVLRTEVLNLSSKLCGEALSIELVNHNDAACSLAQFVIELIDVIPKAGGKTHPCNDNLLFGGTSGGGHSNVHVIRLQGLLLGGGVAHGHGHSSHSRCKTHEDAEARNGNRSLQGRGGNRALPIGPIGSQLSTRPGIPLDGGSASGVGDRPGTERFGPVWGGSARGGRGGHQQLLRLQGLCE
mmetsp:Transcript_147345/g.257504  ORF Transcript_147345/g.257504 Transcript_147345/m.257504 type:complete len:377 (+) Transcript_147345:1612-2742(+)